MRFTRTYVAIAIAAALILPAPAAGRTPPPENGSPTNGAASDGAPRPFAPPAALARFVYVSDPRISPDGSRVAFTANDSLNVALSQIWMVETTPGARPRPFAAVGPAPRLPRWSPDGRQLLFLAARADTAREQIQLIPASGDASWQLTGEPRGVTYAAWSPDGRRIAYLTPGPGAFSDPVDAGAPPAPIQLRVRDLETNRTTTISPDTTSVWTFTWAPNGRRLAVVGTPRGTFGQWRRGYLALVDADGRNWTRIPGRANPNEPAAFSPDGRLVAFYALPGTTMSYGVLHVMNGDGSRVRRIEAPGLAETSENLVWSPARGLLVKALVGVRNYITRVDPLTGERTRLVEREGMSPGSFSVAQDGTIAFDSEAHDRPGDLFLLPPDSAGPRRLTEMNPGLKSWRWVKPEVVTWTSFDGRRVEGILYLPPDRGTRPVPLVVLPHGGPSWQWTLGWFADAHAPAPFLAARGYACLLPNPRGSTGYGEEFNGLNRGDLGGGDHRDIEAGVDSLIGAGVADAKRLAIAGLSYGGYMTAWTTTRTDRYRCAIVGAGPMNFYSDYAQNDLTPYWQHEFLGTTPWEKPEAYLQHSPLWYVRQIRTPTLIVHGEQDVRVPLMQSRELFHALRENGVPAEFYIYPREGHGFSEPAHQIDLMNRTLGWLERWMGPAGGARGPRRPN